MSSLFSARRGRSDRSRRVLLGLAVSALVAFSGAASANDGRTIHLALIESLSGPFANTGEAVYRNLVWATERVNARGGVRLPDGSHPLVVDRYDSKGQPDEALAMLHAALDDGTHVVLQGNSSAVASALIGALDRDNERDPSRRAVFLNYAAVDPALTNERCSFWHFRFDADADMRMTALMRFVQDDRSIGRVYLFGQDYSFGRAVLSEARRQLETIRPDARIVGEDLHPLGRVKDFAPYATRIMASRADAVVTGNWGNDLALLVRAAHDAGFRGRFYTFYGNALGTPAAIRHSGVGQVVAVADWMPNVATSAAADFYRGFRRRYPKPVDDYVHLRLQLMIEALAQAYERAGTTDPTEVARALETADVALAGQRGRMRALDHQFQQPLVVGVMDRVGAPGVPFDVEGSGYGFRIVKTLSAADAELPSHCRMVRPEAAPRAAR